MNKLIDFFVGKSLLVNLFTALIIVVGILSMFSLDKETFPDIDFETVVVTITYPGSTAKDVETLISIPVERKLHEVDGLETINVMSGEGYSIAVAKVDPSYDIDEVRDEIRNKIDTIKNFPSDVEAPVTEKIVSKAKPVMMIGLSGREEKLLRKEAKKLRDKIENIPRISSVELTGLRDQVFYINVDFEKLNKEEMSLAEISNAIADRKLNLTAGSIDSGDKTIMVRTFRDFTSVKDIEQIVIKSNYSGNSITVKDVARVVLEFKDSRRLERVAGQNAILLNVKMKKRSDIISMTDSVKSVVEKSAVGANGEKVFDYHLVNQAAFYVKRRLGILANNGLVGILLVFFCLLLFLNFRVSVITSLGAPLAFMVAFICMDYIGISLNLISMFGLILVLGMLVDDSIIVAENFYQKVEEGMKPKEAAKVAAKETLLPVTTTIITTIMAFGSLFLLGGIWGKFLWPVPAVVLICLIASWIECFFILPSHLADFVKVDERVQKDKWYKPYIEKYKSFISKILEFDFLVIIGFILLFMVSLGVFWKFVDKEMFPDDDVRVVLYKVKGKVGTSFEETIKTIEIAEKKAYSVLKEDEIENIRSTIGSQRSALGTPRTGDHYGSLMIYLTTEDKRERSLDEIFASLSEEFKDNINGFEGKLEKAETGKPTKPPIEIELFGDSLEELSEAAEYARQRISTFEGVISSEVDFEKDYKQIQVEINENQARRLGVNNRDIALELRRAIEGITITEVRKSDEDIDVIIRLDKKYRKKELLEKINIPTRMGRRVPLNKVASVKDTFAPYIIRRKGKKRVVTIYGDIDTSVIKAGVLNNNIEKELKKSWKYEDIEYKFEGEYKDTQDTQRRLMKSALISLSLIFIVLVAQFNSIVQPLIVMSAIPFGLIGVIGIFWILQMSIGFMALMGVIGLIGVVVNDSIVLVTFINNKINEGASSIKEAVVKGSVSRFRAVILTTFTTVAGILPIAHMPGGDPFLKPMAFSFAYGLLFSTTLTLIFVPCVFHLYARFVLRDKVKLVSKD